MQEILLRIHWARHTWRPDRPFVPWMWAIARNEGTDALLRQTRERSRRELAPDGLDADSRVQKARDDSTGDPGRQIASDELGPQIAEAPRTLSDAQRQAVGWLCVEQLPVAEAAAGACVTTTALRVRAHGGSRVLRAVLQGEKTR